MSILFNSLGPFLIVGVIVGFVIMLLIKNIKISLIIASIPAVFGILMLIFYFMQLSRCNQDSLCQMGQAGMLLFFGAVLCGFSLFNIAIVFITSKVRNSQ